ncbi:Pleckstrin homology domain, Mcp5-type [Penicillium griseofulvum]|uniref:Pleckstrin homology domain, Mcp5-type n=1 Tax=Penicillium patulum TaxID=5078 RepID=A0A135M0G5_PENPA|nr:Pleckstrin homology domain, Mcp5-type [Penicillium griseofulvum]KXG54703.1 Pleckstrin homology domain, Mcp5-type [Penicillium griseofulvum]
MADLQSPASMAHQSPAPSFRSRSRAPSNGRSRSRPSLRRDSSPPSSPPTGLPTPAFSPDGQTDEDDIIEDTLSPFDPRRITPTLHASLVSEILSLRREIENKTKSIDVLENSLDESRTENETLTASLSKATWEGRSLKHQIQLLEGGTSSAMTELARERDEAVESIGDVRKKLEQAQKKVRSREENLERTQLLWSRDQDSWADERRALERKVHVVEGRLKTVLNEVAAAQEVATIHSSLPSENGDLVHDKNKESDSVSVASSSLSHRRTSVTSMSSEDEEAVIFHSMRYSVMSIAPGVRNGSGLNLAEELNFDDEDEFVPSDDELPVSPEALPEERPMSVHSQGSHSISSKARRILGLSLQSSDSHSPTAMEFRGSRELGLANSVKVDSAVEYRDIGVQYSPPPSPTMEAKVVDEIVPESTNIASEPEKGEDNNANIPETKGSATLPATPLMVSTSCQTVDDLPSPPWTPNVAEPPHPVKSTSEPVQMVSTSTQTDVHPETDVQSENRLSLIPDNDLSKMDIPMIAIHPPGSEPPSPRNSVVLPPQTKNIACQANFREKIDCRSVAIQTEEIRIDQRPVKLPASLLPSAIQDVLPRSEPHEPSLESYTVPPLPPRSEKRNQRRLITDHPVGRPVKPPRAPGPDHVQAYPGNNDNGPLSDGALSNIRRPLRSSSLFAGFEHNSDDEGPHSERDVFTDDELLNRPFAAYTVSRGKLITTKSRPSLDDMALPEVAEQLSSPESKPPDISRSRASQRSGTASSSIRQPGMRKMAMISSGTAAHQKPRARSPSEPSLESGSAGSSIAPPFPVPMRLSSRKLPLNGSDGPPSPTRSSGRQFSDRGRQPVVRRPTIRRVRSAAATSQSELTERPETRSSPSRSISTFSPESPTYRPYRPPPPMPCDEITAPRERYGAPHRATPSQTWNRDQRERKDSTGGVQPTSVVDAIAQTMVGEWMFKYVRRRKSFGMGESKEIWEGKNPDDVSANITNSGVRHKRWVWLAPYEGSIMWSSKQPTSGPALLGKSGRKCKSSRNSFDLVRLAANVESILVIVTIQSVLDVKDDNPLPKGAGFSTPFNRSILVLTPQRALKFTALTIERHYVWLTALSFLSHSSMGLQELAALPPVPQEESPTLPHAFHRRNPIRDSIRVAKGRPRPMPKGKRSFNSASAPAPVPEIPGSSIDLAADAPHVPRFSTHNRKRSNTAPRPPALHALRSFSSAGTIPSSHSGTTAGSSELHFPAMQPSAPPPGIGSRRSSISRRTSEASGRAPSAAGSNMFDIGTVRMEAFIDHHAEQINRPRAPPRQRHTRKTSSQWSERRYEFDTPSVQGSEFSYRPEDPWRGF